MLSLDKCVFFHFPKTGGTWVKHCLRQLNHSVINLDTAQEEYRSLGLHHDHLPPDEYVTDKFTFTFVRSPYTWYQSYWSFKLADGWKETGNNEIDRRCGNTDFNTFVKNCIETYPEGLMTKLFKRFRRVDFIGKQENLKEDLIRALDLSGQTYDDSIFIDKLINESSPAGKDYDLHVKNLVRKHESWIFETYGYTD